MNDKLLMRNFIYHKSPPPSNIIIGRFSSESTKALSLKVRRVKSHSENKFVLQCTLLKECRLYRNRVRPKHEIQRVMRIISSEHRKILLGFSAAAT